MVIGAATLGLSVLGGCTVTSLGSPTDSTPTNETDSFTRETTTGNTEPATSSSVTIDETSLTSGNGSCGTSQHVDASVNDTGVVVEGEIASPTPCHVATLDTIGVIDQTLQLAVGIEEIDDEICGQCLATIPFELTVSLDTNAIHTVVITLKGTEQFTKTVQLG